MCGYGFFKKQPKNLVIHISIGWSLYVMIFSVNLWCATHTHAVSLHSFYSSILLFILSYSLKNLVDHFTQLTTIFTWLSSFFCIRTFPHQSFGNIWFTVWVISPCRQWVQRVGNCVCYLWDSATMESKWGPYYQKAVEFMHNNTSNMKNM